MSIKFQLTALIPVELHNPSVVARSLVRALSTPNYSLDDLMSSFLCFFPELATSFHGTGIETYSDPRIVFLATAVLRQFYDPAKPFRPSPILIERLDLVMPVVVPAMLHALDFSTDPGEMQSYRPEDVIVLSTLATLLRHEQGIAQFAQIESSMLAAQIRSIVGMWIQVSGSTFLNVLSFELGKIIDALREFEPTRCVLGEVIAATPCSLFRRGLSRLIDELDNLNPGCSVLPKSLLTNMHGIGAICEVCPALRHYLFGHGLVKTLCSLLAYAIIDQPGEKYRDAYPFVLAISKELYLLLKDETESPTTLLEALDARLFESIRCAVRCFGGSRLTQCGMMPDLLEYIGGWAVKSRRVAHKVRGELDGFKDEDGFEPKMAFDNENRLVKAWGVFVREREAGVLDNVCMRPSCNARGRKRCRGCKILKVCSEPCFKELCDAGVHTCRQA